MSPVVLFLIAIALFLFLLVFGMPISFSFAIVGFTGVVYIKGLGPGFALLGTAPFTWASYGAFIVVPLFILMGQFAFHSGISQDLYVAANKWVGRLPGGLALATNLACTGFAACTGSSLASAATMGMIAYPEMIKFKYDPGLATGTIAAGGTLGFLIPPSLVFIIYGAITETSISALFIAGILPGLMLSSMFSILILAMCLRNPRLGPPGRTFPWAEMLSSLRNVWGMLALFVLVIGGMYLGIFAPSEAGAAGAFGALVVALMKRQLNKKLFVTALIESAKLSVVIVTILIGATMFTVFVTATGFPTVFGAWVTGLAIPPYAVLAAILFIYIPLGMVMDALPMILLTMSTVFPIIVKLGFDPVWFGVLVVLMSELALITPPVGLNVYVTQAVTKVPLDQIFKANVPFMLVLLVAVVILIVFPQIALFLPTHMR